MKERGPAWWWGFIIVAMVIVIGFFDWLTGYEIDFFMFYFLPVALGAWFFGLGASCTLAVVCSVVWAGADILSGHEYTSHFYAVWNNLIRFISFLAMGWSVYRIHYLLAHEREITEALNLSLAEIKILEAIIPICAQCKKIRNEEGHWQQLESYLREHAKTQFSHGYCPECAKNALKEAGLMDEKTEKGGGHDQ